MQDLSKSPALALGDVAVAAAAFQLVRGPSANLRHGAASSLSWPNAAERCGLGLQHVVRSDDHAAMTVSLPTCDIAC